MATEDRVIRLVDTFAAQRRQLEQRILSLVAADLNGFDGWYVPATVAELSRTLAQQVMAGQRGVAALTDTYLARVSTEALGRTVGPAGVAPEMSASLRRGVTAPEVYDRVSATFRWQESTGVGRVNAAKAALTRANEMAVTDLGLAHQRQASRFMQRARLPRYRRVIRTESACGLCAAAAQRIYFREDLMPIHAYCKCAVVPAAGGSDVGKQLNDVSLNDLYAAAGSTRPADLRKVTVVQHGELGPQLWVSGQHFRGPAQVAA